MDEEEDCVTFSLQQDAEQRNLPHRKRIFSETLSANSGASDGEGDGGGEEPAGAGQLDDDDEYGDDDEEEGEEETEDAELDEDGLESGGDTDGEQELRQGEEQGELDPLALVEEDAQGKLPYEQFERLEYEALAARKRRDRQLAKKAAEAPAPKTAKYQDVFGADVDEIWESAGFGPRRRGRREPKKRGRKKLPPGGVRLTPEVNKKLGDANLLYATGKFDEAIKLLSEVVKLAPYVPDSYHTLGLVHEAMGNRKKSLSFYMIAAAVTPKDSALWKRLASWSMEQGNIPQVIWCLSRAIKADPHDEDAKWDRASLYVDLGDFKKAADAFEQILVSRPSDVDACKMVSKMQHKIGNVERATQVLENLLEEHPAEADLTAVNLLAELHMRSGTFSRAILQIDRARHLYCAEGLPLDLAVKAGICHAYSGNLDEAEMHFEDLRREKVEEFADLILDVGDAYLALEEHERALKYLKMLDGVKGYDKPEVWLKIAECHVGLRSYNDAIPVYRQVVKEIPHHVEARLTLATFLYNLDRNEEALALLVPPDVEPHGTSELEEEQAWWTDPKVRLYLAEIYYNQKRDLEYVEVMLPLIQESLHLDALNQKERQAKARKGLHKSVLAARVRLLDEPQLDQVFQGFSKPFASRVDLAKAARAKKQLAKRAAQKEEKKVAALEAGLEWESDEDSDEPPEMNLKVPPLPNLLKDDEHYSHLIRVLQTCKTLGSMGKYFQALDVIHNVLATAHNVPKEKRDELRALGAQIAYKTKDSRHGYECVRYMVQQQPYSNEMWNCYYQVVSPAIMNRAEARVPKHNKFMLQMRGKYPDCLPAIMIYGHQFAMISQPQGALREYLQAYKYKPDNPFVCLCIGVALINLSLGFRLSNRNQTILQGFTFLYQYQRLSKYTQESNYNIARAFHHVGIAHLAVLYYEKVLAHVEKDHPIVRLPHQKGDFASQVPEFPRGGSVKHLGHCDLRREAAHNLHLLYRKSGAVDLARQVLKDHCSF